MGVETAVALGLSALSAGAAAKNQHDVLKRQDNEAASGIAAQASRQRQADQRVSQEVDALQSSTPEAERAQANAQFMNQLQQNRAQQYNGGRVGASSDEFSEDTKRGASNVVDFGKKQAGVLSRISAPGRQRTNEQVGFGRLGGDLGRIGRGAEGDAFLSQLRMRGIGKNPWIDAAAGIGQGAASGMAQNSGYGDNGDQVITLDNGYQFTNKRPTLARGNY